MHVTARRPTKYDSDSNDDSFIFIILQFNFQTFLRQRIELIENKKKKKENQLKCKISHKVEKENCIV